MALYSSIQIFSLTRHAFIIKPCLLYQTILMLIHFHMLSLYKSFIVSKYVFSHAFNLLKSNHEIQTYTPKDVFSLQIPFTLIKVCYFTSSIQFTFMTDSIWWISSFLSFGNVLTHLTISVSHHDGCRLVNPTMQSFKNVICHHDGCRLVNPTMQSFKNVICHHDGYQLVL